MRIWTSRYHLTPRRALSSRVMDEHAAPSLAHRDGALVRVEFAAGEVGFADVHPWVELGDDPLDLALEKLAHSKLTPLTERSLALAQQDALARRARVNLFDSLVVPDSHFLLTSMDPMTRGELMRARDRGFEAVKIKIGRNLTLESAWLRQHEDVLEGMRLRLDANATPGLKQIADFLDRLPASVLKQIEFIEDPCVFHQVSWSQVAQRVPVAFDQAREFELEADRAGELGRSGVTHLIVKPAVQDPERMFEIACRAKFKMAITSYLDHPVGQMGAALVAGQIHQRLRERGEGDRLVAGGLLSQVAYQPNEFTHAWRESDGPDFQSAPGTGIGFDDLLENQSWSELL